MRKKVTDMSRKPATGRSYYLYTYDDMWNDLKNKLKLTESQLQEEVRKSLQINAWGDILEGIESSIEFEKNPPEWVLKLRKEMQSSQGRE